MKHQFISVALALMLAAVASIGHASLSETSSRQAIEQLVVERAVTLGFPPDLALAVARVESNFDPDAVSDAGAIGVMQIMPRTGLLEFGLDRRSLFDARQNIDAGISFLQALQEQYGRTEIALSHLQRRFPGSLRSR